MSTLFQVLPTQEPDEPKIYGRVLTQAILDPSIRLDSVGAVFLSSQNPFINEVIKEDDSDTE